MTELTLDVLDPSRTALLVIDMQNAFCHAEGTLGISGVDVASAQTIVEPIRGLVEGCRAAGVPVLWSQQVHFATDAGRARKRLPSHTQKRARVSALAGTWDMEIVEGLKETDCIAVVRPEWESTAHAVWGQYLGVLATSSDVLGWLERAHESRATGLGHLLLQVENLDAAESFYFGLLGLTVRKREEFRDGRPLVVTNEGLGLTSGRPPGQGPLEHVAFRARGIAALAERARAEGVTVVRGPEPSSYGVSLYLADPDGNVVEVFGEEIE
jgi:catechol 2,3-dioxygenase-like lactoylglutathione lyase family enzyme